MNYKKIVKNYKTAEANLLQKQQEYNNKKTALYAHAKDRLLEEISKCGWVAKRSDKDTIGYYLWTDNKEFIELIERYRDLGAFKDPFKIKYSFGEIVIRDGSVVIIPTESGFDELDQYIVNCDIDDIVLGVEVVNEKIDILQNKIDAIGDDMKKRKKGVKHG